VAAREALWIAAEIAAPYSEADGRIVSYPFPHSRFRHFQQERMLFATAMTWQPVGMNGASDANGPTSEWHRDLLD
jgi:hypothetical protein